jgi:hypothetical protein
MDVKLAVGLKKELVTELADEVKALANKKKNGFVDSKVFQDKLREIFETTDYDNNGVVSHDEIYTMVLLLYLYVAQYTTINAKTIPSRTRVEELYMIMDANGDGTLDFEEFRSMAILLVEDMAARVGMQVVIKSVAGPVFGYMLVEIVRTYLAYMGITMHNEIGANLPDWLYNEAMAITVATAMTTMFLLPYVINLVDRIMNVKAASNNSLKILKDKARKAMKEGMERPRLQTMKKVQ